MGRPRTESSSGTWVPQLRARDRFPGTGRRWPFHRQACRFGLRDQCGRCLSARAETGTPLLPGRRLESVWPQAVRLMQLRLPFRLQTLTLKRSRVRSLRTREGAQSRAQRPAPQGRGRPRPGEKLLPTLVGRTRLSTDRSGLCLVRRRLRPPPGSGPGALSAVQPRRHGNSK